MPSSSKDFKGPDVLDLPDGQSLFVKKTDDGCTYQTRNVSKKSLDMIEQMREQEMFCDVTLVAGTVEVPVHKVILAASSIFFYTMFSNIVGNLENRVVLNGVHHEALTALIHYFYTSDLLVTEENVRHLLRASKMLVLTDVYNACCHFLQGQISLFNCLSIADFAREHNCTDVMASADAFIQKHFSELIDSNELLEVPHYRLSQIIKSDQLVVASEVDIFKYVITWIKHDINSRLGYLASLMEFVRFPLMSVKHLIEVVQEESLFITNGKCHDFYVEALKYHAVKGERELSFSTSRTKPRQKKYMIVVGVCNNKRIMEKYDFMRQVLLKGPQSFEKPCGLKSLTFVADRNVFIIGGAGRNCKVDMFDVDTEKWSECNNLLQGRESAAATILENKIYVTGGLSGNALMSGEIFDREMGGWTRINDMLDARYGHGMCAMDGKIYVVGGRYSGFLSSGQCYSPATNTWTYLRRNMSTPRFQSGVTALDGKMYVIGGCNANNTTVKSAEVFDPVSGNWTNIADMNVARTRFGVVVVGNALIYVVGGHNGNVPLNSIEVYDPRCNTWTMLPHQMNNCMEYVSLSCPMNL